mmetsp:Transcript_82597/g.252419  ORF Transcript_82597/g.252419 Transcript_82597/m.252419 type:complete len:272 (-) Transcript_82597:754-1569(-)
MGLDGRPVRVEHGRPRASEHRAEVVRPMPIRVVRSVGHVFVLPHDPTNLGLLEPIQPLQRVFVHQAARLGEQRIHLQTLGVRASLARVGLVVQLGRRVKMEAQNALAGQRHRGKRGRLQAIRRHPTGDVPKGLAAHERHAEQHPSEPPAHLGRGLVHLAQIKSALLPRDGGERHEPAWVDLVDRLRDLSVERREPAFGVLRRHDPRLREEASGVRLIEQIECEHVRISAECLGQDLPIGEHMLECRRAQIEKTPVGVPGGEADLVLVPFEF